MRKYTGIHFYINIYMFNQIISDEESKTGRVTHLIHAMDTFFTAIERYGNQHFPVNFVIEKITGSRLHLYVKEEQLIAAYEVVKAVSHFAYRLTKYINKEISKYKTLDNFYIQIGAAYGKFYDFQFSAEEEEDYTETTTIGYAANFAAKLQALAKCSYICVSEDIYSGLELRERDFYQQVNEKSIRKYDQSCYYTSHLSEIKSMVGIKEDDFEAVKEYANSFNLSEIEYSDVRKPLNYRYLSKTRCKEIIGIPVFADIRGFTKQFDADDVNLKDMAKKTQAILKAMYKVTKECKGVHVQFQGDRELSVYHNIPKVTENNKILPEEKCFKTAVLAAMRLVDAVKPFAVQIGVGGAFGTLFAAKLGARGSRDNILLGISVVQADMMEDKFAGEGQVAITKDVYDGLKAEDTDLARQFTNKDDYYITTIGFEKFMKISSYDYLVSNTESNSYNGALGELL